MDWRKYCWGWLGGLCILVENSLMIWFVALILKHATPLESGNCIAPLGYKRATYPESVLSANGLTAERSHVYSPKCPLLISTPPPCGTQQRSRTYTINMVQIHALQPKTFDSYGVVIWGERRFYKHATPLESVLGMAVTRM